MGYAARTRSGRYDSSADASSGGARNCCATWWPSPKRAHGCSVSGSYSIRDTVEKTPACTTIEVCEADLVWDLSRRLEARLTALGVRSWVTRGPNNGATDEQRATFANEIGADLLLSLHIDAAPSPKPNGIATYHYGAGESSSTIGERLADLAQRELVARTRMLDAHVHGKTWTLLRMTRMPAVRVEVGYLSSPADRSRLVDPTFRDTVAEGLLVAVQRLYSAKGRRSSDRRIASPGRRLLTQSPIRCISWRPWRSFSVPADVRPAHVRRSGHADSAHLCHDDCCEDATPAGAHRPGRCAARS